MARNVVMSDLVTRCQRRADRENDSSIAPAEWKAMISESYAQLYAVIVESGMRHFEGTFTITAGGGNDYAGPVDQFVYVGIDRLWDGTTTGRRTALRELMEQERNVYAGQTGDAVGYSFVGSEIFLYPAPQSGTYLVLYVPQPPDLSVAADTTNVDLVVPDGEAFVLWDVAVKALAKSEQDPSVAMRERDAARIRVEEWAVLRALNEPRRRIVRSERDDDYGFPDRTPWWWR